MRTVPKLLRVIFKTLKELGQPSGIVLCDRWDDWELRVPVQTGNFSPHHRIQTGFGATQIPMQWVPWALSLEVKLTNHAHLVPR
jgi:hypothetical protein